MGYTTVRISDAAHETLKEMARVEKRSMQALLQEAVEALRRKRFLDDLNAGYAALRGDAKAWAAVEKERAVWDGVLLDGLSVREPRASYAAVAKRKSKRKKS